MTVGKAEGLPVPWSYSHKPLNDDLRDILCLRKRRMLFVVGKTFPYFFSRNCRQGRPNGLCSRNMTLLNPKIDRTEVEPTVGSDDGSNRCHIVTRPATDNCNDTAGGDMFLLKVALMLAILISMIVCSRQQRPNESSMRNSESASAEDFF
jgi:hypothetical protein